MTNLVQANKLFKTKKYNDALRIYEKIVESAPDEISKQAKFNIELIKKIISKKEFYSKYTVENNKNYQSASDKIRVCLIVPGGAEKGESSTFIRLINPLDLIKNEVTFHILPKDWVPHDVEGFDICIIQRNSVETADKAELLKSVLKKNKISLIVDVDDAFGDTEKHKNNTYVKRVGGILKFFMNNADMIWFSTEELKNFYNIKICKRQYVVSNALDHRLWKTNKDVVKNNPAIKASSKIKFIYMGTKTHDDDFYNLVYPALCKAFEKHPGKFELTIVGAVKNNPQESWIKVENIPQGFMKYPEFVSWFMDLDDYDIGLSPLEINNFNDCKTDIKALDYLAKGCVPMLSECLAYSSKNLDDFSIIVNNNNWYAYLIKVIENPEIIKNKKAAFNSDFFWESRSLHKISNFMLKSFNELINKKLDKIDCLISCWLGVDDILLKGLTSLSKHLEMNGVNSAFMLSSPVAKKIISESFKGKIIEAPAVIKNDTSKCGKDFRLLRTNLEDLHSVNSLWSSVGPDLHGINAIYVYWREFLVKHELKYLLIWGSSAPMSQLLIALCENEKIDYCVIERGHFPGTFLLDSRGQLGFGTKQRQLSRDTSYLYTTEYINKRKSKIKEWLDIELIAQYHSKNIKNTDELDYLNKVSSSKNIILFIGSHDLGSGMNKLDIRPRSNTWFASSQEAFEKIVDVISAGFSDSVLVAKPHPSAKLKIDKKNQNFEFIYADSTSINELIKVADVCITTCSTAIGICMAYQKPVLQLGITDVTGSNEIYNVWHPSQITPYIRDALCEKFAINNKYDFSPYVFNLFENDLIGVDKTIPTNFYIKDMADFIFKRVFMGVNSYDFKIVYDSKGVSEELFEDISNRERETYDLSLIDNLDIGNLPKLAIIIPVYGDLQGLKRCIESVVEYRTKNNNYEIVMVWDCGPDSEILDYCHLVKHKYNIDLIENKTNLGFSGSVNKGIMKYSSCDIVLLNSDTIVHSDWALRMQKAAYLDPKIGSVNPLSNNATLNNIPFPKGMPFPEDAIRFVQYMDEAAKNYTKKGAEVLVSHGFCVLIKRNIINIVGLMDELKFGRGHSEDNEYSLRMRSKGFKCITVANVFVGHDGGTSFKDESEPWKVNGRNIMREEFPRYFDEVKSFFNNDPLRKERKLLENYVDRF